MLSFNTCFPVTPDATIDELLTIGKKWREGSPHSTITGLINSQFCLNKECYIENTTETLHFQKYTYNDYEIGGIRHTVKENDLRWATEIIGYKKDDAYWVSVKVSKESSLPQLDFHESKKPHIVKLILQKMGAGFDGNMPVGDEPIFLKDGEEDIAKMAMEDSLGCVMPTVYISIKNDGTHNIRYWEIAKRLSGMAHIIVEPSVNFSYTLKEKVNDINAYNGAIGIYWPGNMNRLFFVQRGDNSNPYKIENDVCRVVRRSLLSQRGIKECTWLHLQEVKSKLKIQELRNSGSQKVDEYVSAFDAEIEATKDELNKAKKEIERLTALNYSNTMRAPIHGESIIVRGDENDKYKGEINDILLEIIDNSLGNCEIGSRKRDILEDILSSNNGYGERKRITSKIKTLLKSYKKMDSNVRSGLEQLGFSLLEEGKHYKIKFYGDDRYTVILPKTSSDHRAGRNTASDFIKTML